ncbi:hypothetical protein P8452_13035 [Trifolium repens]|nr:hypothetical protein P8452_13035 [Trifolium repens]
MEKIAPAKQISESRAPTTKYPHGFRNKNQQRTTLIPERKTPTFKGGRRPESGKTQNRHQPPRGLDAAPPHDPCGPAIDGEPEDDGERLGKREEAWTAGGKELPQQTNNHHREGGDAG